MLAPLLNERGCGVDQDEREGPVGQAAVGPDTADKPEGHRGLHVVVAVIVFVVLPILLARVLLLGRAPGRVGRRIPSVGEGGHFPQDPCSVPRTVQPNSSLKSSKHRSHIHPGRSSSTVA
jgi:hypothetical protein